MQGAAVPCYRSHARTRCGERVLVCVLLKEVACGRLATHSTPALADPARIRPLSPNPPPPGTCQIWPAIQIFLFLKALQHYRNHSWSFTTYYKNTHNGVSQLLSLLLFLKYKFNFSYF